MISKLALSLGIFATLSFFYFDQKIASFFFEQGFRTLPFVRYVAYLFSPAIHILGAIAIALFAFVFMLPQRISLFLYATTLIASGSFTKITKYILGRARPLIGDFDPYLILPLNMASQYHSFPSGHACVCATLGTLLSSFFPRYQIPIIAAALLIPMVRVIQVKHFMSDVLFGLCAGLLITQAILSFFHNATHLTHKA